MTLISGAPARAQDVPAPAAEPDQQAPTRDETPVPTPADEAAPAENTGQDIVVTGSRLQAAGFTAPTPTTVLGTGAIALRAPVSVSEVVNRLPAVRNSVSPNANQRQFGGGTSPVDLRGLGPVRTLTLVDGNRFTPTLEDGTVDTSLIPVGLIERIDVVTGGASAAYGSDAVAGVVNFVLAKKLQGVRLSLQAGVSERGDGSSQVLNLAAGTSFAGGRGHIVAGLDATNNDGVGIILGREWGRLYPGQITYGATRPAGTPALGFATGVNYSTQSVGGLITAGPLRGQAFAPDGSLYPFQYGTVYSNLMVGGSNPGSEVFHWPIQTPVERIAGMARVEYELTDAITAFAVGSYGWTRADTFTGFNQSSFVISRDNAFLPAATRAAMVANNLQTITVGRLLTENGGVPQRNTFETWRAIGGFTGTLGPKWSWDASIQYGESTNEFRFLSQIIPANYRAAVNAVRDASGNIVCGPLATNPNLTPALRSQVQPGCVPINIFGQGAPSAAALAYIGPETYHDWTNTRLVVAGNLRGSPFATWAGDVQIAIGGEARRDELTATSDPYSLAAIAASGNYGAYSGRVNVTEFYGEVGVPLARDWTFAKSLEVNGAVRRTDYSTSGAVTTWKAGVTWEPFDAVRLRGTLSRDIRAPNLAELFAYSGAGVSVNSTVNPFNNQTGALSTSTNGNPNLQPEVARTRSAGIVLQPDWNWAQGLKLSADYFDIDVRGLITQVAATQVIARCFAGETVYCPQIQFDNSAFGIANVQQLSFNLNRLRTRGLDFEVAYRVPLPESAGRLDLRVLATHILRLTTYDRGTVIERAGSLANGGLPRWVGTADLTWALDAFTTTLSGRYTASAINDVTRIGPDDPAYSPALPNSININKFPSAVYLDLNIQQRVALGGTEFTFFGLVENLLDKEPPVFAGIGILTGNPYDLVGRRFKFGARMQF
ncbi:TonB-dependent receptor domain-containing protein [Sphingomonas guangdongensis]|nr:TonB-dependent receptor [Sphingomonas guangdongensis]